MILQHHSQLILHCFWPRHMDSVDKLPPSTVWMPVLCFTCGMPVQRLQRRFEAAMAASDGSPQYEGRVFKELKVTRDCCRIVLKTSTKDPRLVTPLTTPVGPFFAVFTTIHRSSKADAGPVTMPTTGATAVVPW